MEIENYLKMKDNHDMKAKKEQLLRSADIHPTDEVIARALGEANYAYLEFINELSNLDIQLEWRYYNDGKAWLAKGLYKWSGARGGQNETTVFWLSIWDGFFKVTIFTPQKYREELLDLDLNQEVKQMILETHQMGKLKFFPLVFEISSDVLFENISTLLRFRMNLK